MITFIVAHMFAALASLMGLSPQPIEDGRSVNTTDHAIICGEGEWLNAAGNGCEQLPVENITAGDCSALVLDERFDYQVLLDAGWTGREDDGMEALYPRGC